MTTEPTEAMTDKDFAKSLMSQHKEYVLKCIDIKEMHLEDEDVEGHIWWNKFRNFIKEL